ncbi:hypothetical protein SAMN04487928_11728 [Butyrivibrio proteoclasticus]|uniref:Uncharacterized protein n=1 Tax=Butyrivibrio proteoclasticus TaxID=43305 RepID=A0A1I5VGS7_9FIRM|nr:hypothetical protein [Butyrivibrio proteoclasticus]SFQ06592.1 hypothetical protein SAMN04487928_11728 [Butyrivibrio proteoclasticus]
MTVYERLLSAQDKEYREFQTKLVPNISSEVMIGVRTPDMRRIAKEVFNSDERGASLLRCIYFFGKKLSKKALNFCNTGIKRCTMKIKTIETSGFNK